MATTSSLAIDPTDVAATSVITTGAAIADIGLTVTAPGAITPGESDHVVIDLVNTGPSDSVESTTVVYLTTDWHHDRHGQPAIRLRR
ncbi:MAG: hypothetical protein R2706_09530 [Acidimicrobiales bacterium]